MTKTMDKKKTNKNNNEENIEIKTEVVAGLDPDNVNAWEAKYYRALADYQNLEKRVRDERIELIRAGNRELLLRFLPILDTLELAQQHEENTTLKVVSDQFLATLKSDGVDKVKALGEKYDPMTMEVVSTENGEEGVVVKELRSGYLLHDKLLRAAQVIVGSKS